jgi:hypothetical protein
MSSSRSIAAARNKRAGEPVQQQQQYNRPGTSISAQPAFSQQQQQQHQQQQSKNSTPPQNTKLTISDAIGLITLRLGRVEQIIQDDGLHNHTSNIPDNTQIVDKSVINSIINRLDSLEKKEKESTNNTQVTKLEKELRDIKDALMIQMVKYEKFNVETDRRFSDVDAAFVELEKGIQHEQPIDTADIQIETTCVESGLEDNQTIVSSDLKNMIKQEFASEFNSEIVS